MRGAYGPGMAKLAEKATSGPPRADPAPRSPLAPAARKSRRVAAADVEDRLEREAQARARDFIQDLVGQTGLNATRLAMAAGLSQTTLTRPLTDPRAALTARTIELVARRFKAPLPAGLLDQLPPGRNRAHRDGAMGWKMEPSLPSPPEPGPARDVPIYGALMISRGPLFHLNRIAVDMAPRPHGIRTARKTYALRMPDESMAPWRRAGELVFIDPTRPVRRGDHALYLLADPAQPDNDAVCLIREVLAGETAPTARQMAAHAAKGPEAFLEAYVVTERQRVLEWEEVLFG